jgi:hypothetical protein
MSRLANGVDSGVSPSGSINLNPFGVIEDARDGELNRLLNGGRMRLPLPSAKHSAIILDFDFKSHDQNIQVPIPLIGGYVITDLIAMLRYDLGLDSKCSTHCSRRYF